MLREIPSQMIWPPTLWTAQWPWRKLWS